MQYHWPWPPQHSFPSFPLFVHITPAIKILVLLEALTLPGLSYHPIHRFLLSRAHDPVLAWAEGGAQGRGLDSSACVRLIIRGHLVNIGFGWALVTIGPNIS
jgi:hypothetical protein